MNNLIDYPIIDNEKHSEHVDELASRAWDQFLSDDSQRDLVTMAER